jgi:hypothetical protein
MYQYLGRGERDEGRSIKCEVLIKAKRKEER